MKDTYIPVCKYYQVADEIFMFTEKRFLCLYGKHMIDFDKVFFELSSFVAIKSAFLIENVSFVAYYEQKM